jgi:ACS family hexuronate transporter-like MFS transporter
VIDSAAQRYRWFAVAIFVLSSSLNYLDRQALAALDPVIRGEFHLSSEQFGYIHSIFALTYALSGPFAGTLIDRLGLTRGASLAVGVWSSAGIATGFANGISGLMGCRAVLGLAEAAGFPAAGKAISQYLRPAEHALGQAVSQLSLSLGAMAAPPLVVWIMQLSGWRSAFVVTGLLGFVWIPLWNFVARRIPPEMPVPTTSATPILRDFRLWTFPIANAAGMFGYLLWTQKTTAYLVDQWHLTFAQQAWLSWIPPLFGGIGGLAGGWLSKRFILAGMRPSSARFRACLIAAILSIGTLLIPHAPTVLLACAGISLSLAAAAAFSVNMYTLPLDAFGAARAAFAISLLVSSYGVLTFFGSLAIGRSIDRTHSYTSLITLAAFSPLTACGVLRLTRSIR